jgi:outer membrane beta-barrel protein
MKRLTLIGTALLLFSTTAFAQTPDEEVPIEVEPDVEVEPEGEPPTDPVDVVPETKPTPTSALKPAEEGEARESWQDIVTVVRKPFLKSSRIELMPSFGATLNDNMIRHYQFNGQINYWVTEALAVGLEGQMFTHEFLEPYDIIARQYRRLPTLNKYNYGAALNFHYVPVYAKFAMLNKYIVHWEVFATAGVGVTQSEVLPRDPALEGWTNFNITPNVGLTTRVFIADWLTLNLSVRDYIFIDKFESVDRTEVSADEAMENADSRLINHIVMSAGLSFWFPMGFKYTTFR